MSDPEPPHVEILSKRSPWGAILNRTLPNYSGPLPVGVCDVELPVPRQTFGAFTHKKMPDAEAGLAMHTVLFSIFYPAQQGWSTTKRVVWFPKLDQTINGFLKMAKRTPSLLYKTIAYPLAAAAIYGTTFPAKPNAPLRELEPSNPEKKWPLIIFSHGVGCSRLMYSAFCGEMASRGYIVCAIEHRDGTSPSSTIVTEDGRAQKLDWLQWSDLDWPDLETQPADDTVLRHQQIKLRIAEIEGVIKAMTRLSRGEDITKTSIDTPDFDWSRWRSVDTNKPIIAGHSLGGSAAIAAAADHRFDFGSVLAFDPAVQRLEPWSLPIPAPLLVINSEEYTKGSEFQLLAKVVKYATSSLVFSIGGATHPSFSDVFLILPSYLNRRTGLRIDSDKVISLCVRAATQFLNGNGQRAKEMAQTSSGVEGKMEAGAFIYHKL
ncbi:hypothetical protein PILCRDRAFT_826858 [Piloderma croceum F 1598]|uniref:Putative phospholipase n=1 Tax=Piloderma croceum (strain F 1598) TaxID=765440 RepID=A0A0C3F7U1_PILCF|nr:hypothetical protein PILCRDRAFT_826858 [Piloderma croceum F 1598]